MKNFAYGYTDRKLGLPQPQAARPLYHIFRSVSIGKMYKKNQQVLVNLLIEYLCKKCAYNFIEHRGVNVHIEKAVILSKRLGVASNQFCTQRAFRALGGVVSARTDSMNLNARDRIFFRVFADFITQAPYDVFRGSAYFIKFKFVVVVKLEKVNRLNVFQILATIRHKLH